MCIKDILTKEKLYKLYVNEGKNAREIAEELNCSHATICRYLKKFSIKICKLKKSTKHISKIKLEQFLKRGLSAKQIAVLLQCSAGVIINRLKFYNLPIGKKCEFEDLTEKTFGYWTVLEIAESTKRHKIYWKCQCKCGKIKIRQSSAIKNPLSKSCGCAKNKTFGEIPGYYWSNIICGAKKRNLDFTITSEYAWNVYLEQNKKCALTGRDVSFNGPKQNIRKLHNISLDRKDSSKGYIPGNIQWVHKDVNKIKLDLIQEDFINLCIEIANHSQKKSNN